MIKLTFRSETSWRDWLEEHHEKEKEVWLIFYKKGTGRESIDYNLAVEVALCYGWIDSIVRRIDEEKYMRKFTPRLEGSVWSESNIKRVEKLTREGRMTPSGMRKVNEAKKRGKWSPHKAPEFEFIAPPEFLEVLTRYPDALKNFENLSGSHQKAYIGWIVTAKREETRARRISESVAMLSKGLKLGLR